MVGPTDQSEHRTNMKPISIPLFLFSVAFLSPWASAVTATYTTSAQNVTLTGLGGSGGVGQSRRRLGQLRIRWYEYQLHNLSSLHGRRRRWDNLHSAELPGQRDISVYRGFDRPGK